MRKEKGYWNNYEHCYEEAKKYKSRTEFLKKSNGAYNAALRNNWLDNYTWFEEKYKPNGYWNYEHCYEEAKKYKTRSEFQKTIVVLMIQQEETIGWTSLIGW